ncbi:hypothetical protein Tco_0193686 [Tanacetum coccineum]
MVRQANNLHDVDYDLSPSSSGPIPAYYVTHPSFVNDFDDDTQSYEFKGYAINDDPTDSLITTMMLLANDIIFDDPNVEVNSENVEQDTSAHDQQRAKIESLIRNVQIEGDKTHKIDVEVKEANALLTKELKNYKERVQFFENKPENLYDYEMAYNERDSLKVKFKQHEDKYLDDITDLQTKIKDHENIIYKTNQSLQTIHMLGPVPHSYYDSINKCGLGYKNPCLLKEAIAHYPKLYHSTSLCDNIVHVHVNDSEETHEDAEKGRLKMKEKQTDRKVQKMRIKPSIT